MFHCEQRLGHIIPFAKCTTCLRFISQSNPPPIHFPSPSYLVPTPRGPGIDSWPDHVNQLCRSRHAELRSHCSGFFTIADVAGLTIYSTFHFTNFEGAGTVGHIADCTVPALSVGVSKPHSLTFHFEYLLSLHHREIIYIYIYIFNSLQCNLVGLKTSHHRTVCKN